MTDPENVPTALTVAALVRRVTAGLDLPEDHPDADAARQRLEDWLAPALACPDTGIPAVTQGDAWVDEGLALLRAYGGGREAQRD